MTEILQSAMSTPPAERLERLPPPLDEHPATIDVHNARLKLFGITADVLERTDAQDILLRRFDENDDLTKLIAYSTDCATAHWQRLGFNREGRIRRFFREGTDAILWTRYSDSVRAASYHADDERSVLKIALSKDPISHPDLPAGFDFRFAVPGDAGQISALLQNAFSDYPVDISAPTICRSIDRQHAVYVLVESGGEIASMACGEIDRGLKTAEISDCVTSPMYRGRRLMVVAVDRLLNRLSSRFDITDFYSLARAREIGMNAALARCGFTHDGRLINNCRMPTGWETMNVWWRTDASEA